MTSLARVLESISKVRFHDCDPFNHLNNSRYIDYMIAAREDQLLTAYGFDVYELARKRQLSWVVAHTEIAYNAPAQLMEQLVIETRLLQYSNRSLLVESIMWDQHKQQLKSLMWARLVHYNLAAQASAQHNEELMSLFEQIVHPHAGIDTFRQRLSLLQER